MSTQIAKSFSDGVTWGKIGRGALWAVTPAAAIALLTYVGSISISNPYIAAFAAWFVPFAINAVKEYFKGEPPTAKR